ncbi:hypothetical protein POM88_029208 [Heracleum sosnowskyi]|uniref:Uncharacterized protein n=1 Tax=Heracleum sosnowskyi TaxID=360622 RepID=A0AAD8GW62_9APIA|nr:hypothetical protein POM88_054666 [Heracleum sosnowskyi]KAK1355060.1 hypothetical protein POM88_048316 [Heracleum sosnowskyi]KAK1373015.1 hypothetical protein POM88_029208 [Heracleum sosnowskyi]
MASGSRPSDSQLYSFNNFSDEEDSLMAAIDAYEPPVKENIEKSLTNLNVNIATMAQQLEELKRSHQEFSANFIKQEQLLSDEITLLRIEVTKLRKGNEGGL